MSNSKSRSASATATSSDSDSAIDAVLGFQRHPHQFEQEVRRRLLSEPSLKFSTLVVRRLEDGVCLQGILETDSDGPDVETLAKEVSGVTSVINQLLVTGSLTQRPAHPR